MTINIDKCPCRPQQVQIYLTNQEMLDLDKEMFGDNNPHSFLRPCYIHMPHRDSIAAILARMYGATVLDSTSDCTHVVVSSTTEKTELDLIKESSKALIVTEDWLDACFLQKKLIPETEFTM